MSEIKLYVLPASHPCAAVEAALRLKSMPFERIDLLPMTQLLVGPLRYRGKTVPGIRIGGERLTGSRTIMRRLDELTPEPSLLPEVGDPARVRVLEVECWGDEEFQDVARDILPRAFVRNPAVMESFVADDFKLPLPRAMLRPSLPLTARLMTLRSKTSDQTAAPAWPRSRTGWTALTRGSGMACSAASIPTQRICRSVARSACCRQSRTYAR